MGIFDTLKEMKARYDEGVEEKRKREAERIQRERQERERKKREAEEKERMILEQVGFRRAHAVPALPLSDDSLGWESLRGVGIPIVDSLS